MKIKAFFAIIAVTMPLSVYSEVRENNCPFSCTTENIDKSLCRDWSQNGKCYVEDLRNNPDARAQLKLKEQNSALTDPTLDRQIINVSKLIGRGSTEFINIQQRSIDRIDIVLRREGNSTQTQLRANLGTSKSLGQKQVDKNNEHVISFPVLDVARPNDRLELTAIEGNVFIESVHILYRNN